MSKPNSHFITRCSACNEEVSFKANNTNKENMADLCTKCQYSVRITAEDPNGTDSLDMYMLEKFGWREPLGGDSLSECVEKVYQGYNESE